MNDKSGTNEVESDSGDESTSSDNNAEVEIEGPNENSENGFQIVAQNCKIPLVLN